MSNPNVVQALPNPNGTRGPRLEIDEFIGDNEMTNLFLIALSNLQQNSVKPDSQGKPVWANFYGISGIHGYPIEKWNGVSKDPRETGSSNSNGYCHHGLPTFPTWHRPYVALYEQAIYLEMVRVAGLYKDPDSTSFAGAAARFRLPYWDIAMPRNAQQGTDKTSIYGVPTIFTTTEVTVKWPDKTTSANWQTIQNPLYSFTFPTAKEVSDAGRVAIPWGPKNFFNTEHTTRCPDETGETNVNNFNQAVQGQAVNFANTIWQLLTPGPDPKLQESGVQVNINAVRTWEVFSNHSSSAQVNVNGNLYSSPSIESFHDRIHGLIGSGTGGHAGQMGYPPWAAFDPIFYMHHNNVDRLLSLYQALFPNQYIIGSESLQGLVPFANPNTRKNFWNSKDPIVQNYWSPGFAIPGVQTPDSTVNFATLQKAIATYLSKNYYSTTNGVVKATPEGWPKLQNINASWALNGPPKTAPPPSSRTMQMNAVQITNNAASLMSREVAIPELQESNPEPQTPQVIQDTPIETTHVVAKTNTVDSQLPDGAFHRPISDGQTNVQTTWNAHVKVRKFVLDGPFSIHLFIGEVDDNDPGAFMTKDNEVGFTYVFTRGAGNVDGCSNCEEQRAADVTIEDVIPITTTLYNYLDAADGSGNLIQSGQYQTIRNLSPEVVVPFLKEQLKWRMVDMTSNLLTGQEQQAGLQITILSRHFESPTEDNPMGVYGAETEYPDITNDKPGGNGYVY